MKRRAPKPIMLPRSLLAMEESKPRQQPTRRPLQIALRKGQAGEAARRFNEAARAEADYASTLAARNGRIKAEAAANSAAAPDESARTFIAQLDQAIKSGRKTEIEAFIW